MPQLVAATRTPISPQAMWPAMAARFEAGANQAPTTGQLMILMAQWMLETGAGASMVQWNVGNIKHVPGDALDWCDYTTTEYDAQGVKHTLVQSFKAWPSLEAGLDAWLHIFLLGRYSNAWPYVLDGDPDGFAQALRDRGYYTATETSYDANMRAHLRELEAMSLPALDGDA